MRKDELRRQIRQIKRQFTPQQLEELSLPVIARLKARLAQTDVVCAYYSLPDEVCTHQLIDHLVAEGKTVLLPKVVDDETMVWCPYHGAQSLKEGAFHIMEPVGDTIQPSPCDTILVPGVAFDALGHRLGRGRGYYDRFLAARPEMYKIGVCFDFQKVPEVPCDPFDIAVDEVI
jgi:5-formyltetrahydrofolate cyclo-ligase